MSGFKEFIEANLFTVGDYSLTIGKLLVVFLAIIITILLVRLVKLALFREKLLQRIDKGNAYAIFQIIKYFIWIVSILFVLETLGLKLNALLAGSAALLVGVGLGLQNTFNNFIAGVILLFEGSIRVGDVLEIDGDIVKMERIGLRTSSAKNRDDIIIIVPNAQITSNTVTNWSHQSKKTRFRIRVGVAYGSDVDLVIKVLIDSALEHPEINDKNTVAARFIDFGDSSLDFELMFYSNNIFRIENLKSDIRRVINRKFIENGISIPFPQMDVYIKKNVRGEASQDQ